MTSGKPVVLVLPLNAEGHAAPMMHLSCMLAKQGCSIIYVAIESSFLSIQQRGTWPPPDSDILLEPLLPKSPFNYENVTVARWFEMIQELQPQLEELVSKSLPLACIICDFHLDWCVDVASKFGVPSSVLFTGTLSWNWLELQTPELASKGIFVPASHQDDFDGTFVISEQPLLQSGDLPDHLVKPEDSFFEQILHRNSTMWKKVAWVLANCMDACEEDTVELIKNKLGSKYLTIGPISRFNELDGDWSSCVGLRKHDMVSLEWLDSQVPGSILYVSFGSNANPSEEQYREIALGVEASGRHFLWVIRADVHAEGWEFFQDFVDRTKDRGLVVPWCPQTKVLSHPAVAAFLTHAGWNSVQDAISKGQPMVCFPYEYDQVLNSKLVVDMWKVGMKTSKVVKAGVVDRKEVEKLINSVMDSKTMKQNAVEMSEQINNGLLKGGSSFANLDKFVAGLQNTGLVQTGCGKMLQVLHEDCVISS